MVVSKRVLVVDNDRLFVERVGDILTQEGYEVSKAYDGLEAMQVVDQQMPDLILLDVVMPKIDGDRVCQYLKENSRTRGIPVVLLSAAAVEDRAKMLSTGADLCVAKGSPADLRTNILTALQQLVRREVVQGADRAIIGMEKAYPRGMTRELLALQRHYQALLENIGEGVVEADADGRVLYVNPAGRAIFGREELDLIGRPVEELFPAESRAPVRRALTALGAAGGAGEPLTVMDGDRVLQVNMAGIWDEAQHAGTFLLVRDITLMARKIDELSALNQRLRESDRVKSDFLTMLSHDLHTPLTAIKGSLDVLLYENVGPDLGRELLAIAQKNTDRLFRLVSDILDLARIDAGRLEVALAAFDLPVALRAAIDRLHPLAQEKRITLALQVPEGLPLLAADAPRMDQVFTNLLGNALKFTPRGGRVDVEVTEGANEVLVAVRDTGVGIPAQDLARIFDKFYRREPPRGEPVGGAGLGLSICKAIIEQHGGRIWAESQEGVGSTFFFTIPKRGDPA